MKSAKIWGFLRGYARDRLPLALLLLLCPALLALVCYLLGAPLGGLLYACALYAAVLLAAACTDALLCYRRHRELCALLENRLHGATLLPSAHGMLEQDWRALLLCAIDQLAGDADAYARERRDREAYAALWTHQIKVPIAAMRMLLQADPGSHDAALLAELFKVEQYVDMSLGYQRLTGPSTDYVLRPCDINAVMLRTARRFAPLFIQKKLALDCQPTTLTALTDEKWLAFVLEQLLSNAVKYTNAGRVTLRADEESQSLIVEDTGIGIAPEDLPRVCDHGYTGRNGRLDKRATGLGLYLRKRVLDKLGHTRVLASTPGKGTRVTVGLAQSSLEVE